MLLYVHPILQLLALALGLWALVLAWPRFVTIHLKSKRIFRRRRHILLGEFCLGGFILGMIGGLAMVRLQGKAWLATGEHAWGGLILLPLALFGLISGLYLAGSPAQRKVLPLLHGLGNLLVLGLAFYQAHTGRQVIANFAGLP